MTIQLLYTCPMHLSGWAAHWLAVETFSFAGTLWRDTPNIKKTASSRNPCGCMQIPATQPHFSPTTSSGAHQGHKYQYLAPAASYAAPLTPQLHEACYAQRTSTFRTGLELRTDQVKHPEPAQQPSSSSRSTSNKMHAVNPNEFWKCDILRMEISYCQNVHCYRFT